MDCPICYDAIGVQTGIVTTSCGHSFHFSCLSKWYMQHDRGTCPSCRKEVLPIEDLPIEQVPQVEPEEVLDEVDIEMRGADLDILLRLNGGFGLLYVNQTHMLQFTRSSLDATLVANHAYEMSEDQWTQLSNLGIERFIAIHTQEQEEPDDDPPLTSPYATRVSWLKYDGTWTETITNPEEVSPVSIRLDENWTEDDVTSRAAIKIQALWRGYISRLWPDGYWPF